ncbi:MAG: 4-alpha-glucanotransferase [Eubacteriales bacterium]|jgi:4-alpha-glucanotransferase
MSERASGILMPIFSLPGKYGIGCMSAEARRFVDFLVKGGQTYWQILPVGPTGYGDSPYQSFSTFAGNPYFIDLEELIRRGLLTRSDCRELAKKTLPTDHVDYGFQYQHRFKVLRKAYARWKDAGEDAAFKEFVEANDNWLRDYSLFMAVKDSFGGAPFASWDDDIRFRKPEAIASWTEKLSDEIGFYEFLQYEFAREWKELKAYANERGIRIIGDIPIYVSPDSADFWAHPDLFQVDEKNMPTAVAGCPPDGFSADGQLWGNPLYDWKQMDANGYKWWISRIRKCSELFDIVRIDHFRGFDEYFSIKAGEPTAKNGHWEKGPGMKLFNAIKKELGDISIIAEDLGYITDTVRKLVKDSGFPNMKVLEFAFDSRDSSGSEQYKPYNYNNNCVVYTGTHDNETIVGWLDDILPKERKMLREYLATDSDDPQILVNLMICAAENSVADTCIIPMQDWLGLDNSARINHPSTTGTNWQWRMTKGADSAKLAARIRKVTETYGRVSLR